MVFSRDTSPEAREILIRRIREMTPAEKYQQVRVLSTTTRELAKSGLRSRHPGASEDEIRWRFAALCYGRELAEKVYGPLAALQAGDA